MGTEQIQKPLRKLPIGIQSFEDLRRSGYLYVDKTAFVYQLVTTGKPYFLIRPRRFGKSLLLSTLEAYFLGKKELFQGLAIEEPETEWLEYPVLHLSLNAEKYVTKFAQVGIFSKLNQLNDISLDRSSQQERNIEHWIIE